MTINQITTFTYVATVYIASIDSRAAQQCNVPPYFYAVKWLRPASTAFLLPENATDWYSGYVHTVSLSLFFGFSFRV